MRSVKKLQCALYGAEMGLRLALLACEGVHPWGKKKDRLSGLAWFYGLALKRLSLRPSLAPLLSQVTSQTVSVLHLLQK